jgi:hypothetical protein
VVTVLLKKWMTVIAAALGIALVTLLVACLPPRRMLEELDADVDGAASVDDGGCFDPSGFDGHGCYRCAATTNDELLAACTPARFELFDNAERIAGFDPAKPRPPLPEDAGPPYPSYDAGETSSDGGTSQPPPACPIGSMPNPVMVLGATGFPMETIARAMGTDATLFYQESSSCEGVASMVVADPKLSGEIVYYDHTTGAAAPCALSEPHPADITLSALFAETCASQSGLPAEVTLPPDVDDYLGPINVMMLAVPATSPERVISAEAAYRIYGFGNDSGVAPWTDESFIFRRRPSSGNQTVTALSLGLPIGALRGRDSNGSSNMLAALVNSGAPKKTIGISSSEIVDPNPDLVKPLAFQHYGQPVGFYPDSAAGNFDRRNVRDGHYFLWAPLHIFVRTRAGDPVAAANEKLDPDGTKASGRNASVKLLALVMASRLPPPVSSVDLFTALKKLGNVPQCAMRVTRGKEGAPLEPYTSPTSCACAWEAAHPASTTMPEACSSPCSDDSVCPPSRPRCSFGYCE